MPATTLTAFVRREGGVKDFGGELADMLGGKTVRKRSKTGKVFFAKSGRGIIRKRGRDLDDMRHAAIDAGFLPKHADINTLLDALASESRGRRIHSVHSEMELDPEQFGPAPKQRKPRKRPPPSVPAHPSLTKKCKICKVPHGKKAHRFHGEGAYLRTHLFPYKANPMQKTFNIPNLSDLGAKSISGVVGSRLGELAATFTNLHRSWIGFDRLQRAGLAANEPRPHTKLRGHYVVQFWIPRPKANPRKPAKRRVQYAVYYYASDGWSMYLGYEWTLEKAKRMLEGLKNGGFIVGEGGKVIYRQEKRANPRGIPKPKPTKEEMRRRFDKMYAEFKKPGGVWYGRKDLPVKDKPKKNPRRRVVPRKHGRAIKRLRRGFQRRTDRLIREAMKRQKRRANPSGGMARKKPVIIYGQALRVEAKKTQPHRCDAACKRANHSYFHNHNKGVQIEGNPDGSYTVRSKTGKRLWKYF